MFDPNMKKIVIGVGIETQKHGTENKSNGVIKEDASIESEEEDDEVIVFRPKLIDNRKEMPLVKDISHGKRH